MNIIKEILESKQSANFKENVPKTISELVNSQHASRQQNNAEITFIHTAEFDSHMKSPSTHQCSTSLLSFIHNHIPTSYITCMKITTNALVHDTINSFQLLFFMHNKNRCFSTCLYKLFPSIVFMCTLLQKCHRIKTHGSTFVKLMAEDWQQTCTENYKFGSIPIENKSGLKQHKVSQNNTRNMHLTCIVQYSDVSNFKSWRYYPTLQNSDL